MQKFTDLGPNAGVMLNVTSLSGRFGNGEVGSKESKEFAKRLADTGASSWQVLPACPTDHVGSPFSSMSADAGNPDLISVDQLEKDKLIGPLAMATLPKVSDSTRVDENFQLAKRKILKVAAKTFLRKLADDRELSGQYEQFQSREAAWLAPHAQYLVIAGKYPDKTWAEWPEGLRNRDAKALQKFCKENDEAIEIEKAIQFLFDQHWQDFKVEVNAAGLLLIGDLPFGVSNAVGPWANPHLFKLDPDTKQPLKVSGYPPDLFSKEGDTGQYWGNPVLNYAEQKEGIFKWMGDRIERQLRLFDALKIDHWNGFVGEQYEITPNANRDASPDTYGRFEPVPGRELLAALRKRFGDLPIIGEDLGNRLEIAQDVAEEFGIPGMAVLQYAFGSKSEDGLVLDETNPYLPENIQGRCVACDTHDIAPFPTWLEEIKGTQTETLARKYLGQSLSNELMLETLFGVSAETVITQFQNLLGSDKRMNTPGTVGDHNWSWRMTDEELKDPVAYKLLEGLITKSGRAKNKV